MAAVITRTGKGAAITQAENDANLDSLCGVNESQIGTTYTVDAADQNGTIEFSNASPVAVTLTLISTIIAANDTSDFEVTLKNIGAGAATITPTSDTFDDGSATKVLAQYEWMTIQSDSTQSLWNIVSSSDASKVDGLDASQFLRSDIDDTTVGILTVNRQGTAIVIKGTGAGAASAQYISFRDTTGTQLALIGNDSAVSSKLSIINTVSGEDILVTTNGAADIILTSTNINLVGQFQLSGANVEADAADLNRTDIATEGTVEASKVVTADSSKNIIDINDLTVDGIFNVDTATPVTTNGDLELTRNGTGDITVNTIPIYGLVVLDTPELLYSNPTVASNTWISSSTFTSTTLPDASAVKAQVRLIGTTDPGSFADVDVFIRKTGSALAIGDVTKIGHHRLFDSVGSSANAEAIGSAIVNLDSNSDFDIAIVYTAGNRSLKAYLEGYYV